jgi:uncharacterized membrane protein
MSLNPLPAAVAALPFLVGLLAVAGLVHIATILAYPGRAEADAFARIAAFAPIGMKTDLRTGRPDGVPGQDQAMRAVVCRYDLGRGPFRIAVAPFDDGFISFGMHSRSGVAFYGLNLHAADGDALTMLLMTDEQKTAMEQAAAEDPPDHMLKIAAPEPQGFVVVAAPADGEQSGQELVGRVSCGGTADLPGGQADGPTR